ncbi:hypothetical protein COOONC_17568, partial [Cooperia oncophora]
MRCILVCAILGYATAVDLFGRDQSSAVRGRLICDGRPAVGVKVKLWDVDRSENIRASNSIEIEKSPI